MLSEQSATRYLDGDRVFADRGMSMLHRVVRDLGDEPLCGEIKHTHESRVVLDLAAAAVQEAHKNLVGYLRVWRER